MFIREREVKGRTDVNYYTARRLGDMAESLNQLARAFDDGIEKNGQLTRTMEWPPCRPALPLVCDNCNRCNLWTAEGGQLLPLLSSAGILSRRAILILRTCLQMFQSGCRKKEDYLAQLNPEPGKGYHESVLEEPFPGNGDMVISVQGTVGDTGGIFPPD